MKIKIESKGGLEDLAKKGNRDEVASCGEFHNGLARIYFADWRMDYIDKTGKTILSGDMLNKINKTSEGIEKPK